MAGQSYTYNLQVNAEADVSGLNNLVQHLVTIAKLEKALGNQQVEVDVKQALGNLKGLDSQIGNTTKGVKGLDGQDVNVNTKNGVAGLQKMEDEAANTKQVIDSMDSTSIDNIGRSADQTANKLSKMARASKSAGKSGSNLSSNFQNMSSGLSGNGMMSYLGLGSSYENTIGNAMTKEINAITSENLKLDTDYIDKLTSKSMTRMNNLIPALNAGHSSTGKDMQKYVDTYVQVSDAVMALGYSEAEATSAMYDLTKGLNGAFASLDQYGISEDALMKTGLWTGKADDVEGYFKAVSTVLPETEKYMKSFQGDIIGLKKTMSSAGGALGKEILPKLRPIIQTVTDFLTDVDEQGNKIPNTWAKGLMGAFMAFSAVQPAADALGTVVDTFRTIKGAGTGAFNTIKSVISGAKKLRDSISEKGIKGTIIDKFRNKGMDSSCDDMECCDDVCLDSAKELGKQKKKNGKTTQKNQKNQKKGRLEKLKEKVGLDSKSRERKSLQDKVRKGTKNSFASDVKVPKKNKSGGLLGKSKNFLSSGKNAGKGILSGITSVFKGGGALGKLGGTIGKVLGGVGGKVAFGTLAKGALACIPVVGTVITILWTLMDVLGMLGIDWFTPLQDALGGLGETIMQELGNIGSQLMSILEPAWNDLSNALSNIWTAIQPAINALGEALRAILPILGMIGIAVIKDVINRFQMLYTIGSAIWTAIGPVLTSIGQALYKVGHIIYDVLSKFDFGPAGDSAKDFASTIGGLAEKVASFLQPVVDFIDNLDFSSVTGFINDVISGIQIIGGLAMSVLGPVGEALGSLFGGASTEGLDVQAPEGGQDLSGLSEGMSGIAGTVQTIVETVINTMSTGILSLVQGLFDIVTGGITGVINSIGSNISMIITTIATSIMSVITTIGTTIMGIFSTISAGITTVIATIATSIISIISTISGSIAGVIGSIGGAISGVVSSVAGAISGVVGTVAAAITSVISALSTGVVSVVNAIVNGFNQIAATINGQLVAGVAALAAGFVGLTTSVTAFLAIGTPGFTAMAASIVPLATALTGVCAQLVAAAASVGLMSAGFTMITASITMIGASLTVAIGMVNMFGASIMSLQGVMNSVFGAFPGIVSSSMASAMSIITSWCSRVVSLMRSTASRMSSEYRSGIQGIKAATESEMKGAYEALSSWGDKMVEKARQIASDVANAFPENYDTGSPGLIWRTTKAEMKGTYQSLASFESPMTKTAKSIATGVVGAFTKNPINSQITLPNTNNSNYIPQANIPQTSHNAPTINNTVHIDNVTISNGDDKDQFLKDIIHALDFESTRAGRRIGNPIYHS